VVTACASTDTPKPRWPHCDWREVRRKDASPHKNRLQGFGAHIESCCANARRFAEVLARDGIRILNDVVYNQVLFDLGPAPERDRLLAEIQAEGTCWVGPTAWRRAPACRASFCGWSTTLEDAERSAEAVRKARDRLLVLCGRVR
jgi:hypothetical protein